MKEEDIVLMIIIFIFLIGAFITYTIDELIGVGITGISLGMIFMSIWQYRIKKTPVKHFKNNNHSLRKNGKSKILKNKH